jgi:hypothetical protein
MKIAVLTPVHGNPSASYVQSLGDMLLASAAADVRGESGEPLPLEMKLFLHSGSCLTRGRSELAARALEWGAHAVLWIDADMVFPRDTLVSLLARNQWVVGCNYARRESKPTPTAVKDGALVYTGKESEGLEEVDRLGLGLCLVNNQAFAAVAQTGNLWPLFAFTIRPDGRSNVSEDCFFFDRLRAAGVKVWLDHDLSKRIGHMHERLLTLEDTLSAR